MYNYHCIIKSEFPFSRSVFFLLIVSYILKILKNCLEEKRALH